MAEMASADRSDNDFCVIAAVNDEAVLARDLAASPMIAEAACDLAVQRGAKNIGTAYNAGIAATTAPYMVFAHQDVYLPWGWDTQLRARITALEAVDPGWGVLGPIGLGVDAMPHGTVWSSGAWREYDYPVTGPVPVQSLDELVLVIRRDSGLCFDPHLPHFHLYGTDIVQMALAAGHGAYAVHAPVIHNSDTLNGLGKGYYAAYGYMQEKWQQRLPIKTLIAPVDAGKSGLWRARLRGLRIGLRYWKRRLSGALPSPHHDPAQLASRLRYGTASQETVSEHPP
ncbi:MAG: glycosyltransferase [Pseudomonadota bacterium]